MVRAKVWEGVLYLRKRPVPDAHGPYAKTNAGATHATYAITHAGSYGTTYATRAGAGAWAPAGLHQRVRHWVRMHDNRVLSGHNRLRGVLSTKGGYGRCPRHIHMQSFPT